LANLESLPSFGEAREFFFPWVNLMISPSLDEARGFVSLDELGSLSTLANLGSLVSLSLPLAKLGRSPYFGEAREFISLG